MVPQSFNWDDHEDAAVPAKTSGGKFNWDDHDDVTPPHEGLISQIGGGLAKVARTIDSYSGAPTRAALDAAVSGNNPVPAFAHQFGEDPSNAPTGESIARKIGIPNRPIFPGNVAGYGVAKGGDTMSPPDTSKNPTMSGVAGLGIDMAADPINYIPVGKLAEAGVGGLARVSGKATDAVGAASRWAGVKALSNMGGVSPENIKEYLNFSDRINSAKSVDQLKEISDGFVGRLADDVQSKAISADQAHEALKGFQSDLKDGYRSAGYDARDAVTSAQQSLKDAHNARIQNLSSDVYDSVNRLKSDVQTGSQKALNVLDASDATRNSSKGVNPFVDLDAVHSKIDSTISDLKKSGTDESLAVADKLQTYKTRLQGMAASDGTIPATDAKKLIQGLDNTTKYSPMAGAFDDVKNGAFKGIRAALDESTKLAVPEYRKAMEPVARDADLLSRLSRFGDKQSGAGALGNINAPTQLENRAALQELGNKYGADFVSAAHPRNLPEQQILNKAQATQDALRGDRVAEKVDQAISGSRQKAALDSAQSQLRSAQERLAPFKSLAPNAAGQTTAQQKLLQLGKGKNIELDGMFHEMGKLTDTDFVQAMKDNQVKAAFEKGATNGSRNTAIGAMIGYAADGVGGGAVGASAGRIADQWGPAITKRILDGAIKVSKSPTAETIRALSVPDSVKQNMLVGLKSFAGAGTQMARGQSAARSVADAYSQSSQNRSPAKGEDRWAANGAQVLGLKDEHTQALMQSPQGKRLLIQASDLKPGSKAMKAIQDQIQSMLKGAK